MMIDVGKSVIVGMNDKKSIYFLFIIANFCQYFIDTHMVWCYNIYVLFMMSGV